MLSHLWDAALLRGPPELAFPNICAQGHQRAPAFRLAPGAAPAPGHMWWLCGCIVQPGTAVGAWGFPVIWMLSGSVVGAIRCCGTVVHRLLLLWDTGHLEIAINTLHRMKMIKRSDAFFAADFPLYHPLSLCLILAVVLYFFPFCLKTYLGSSAVINIPKYKKVYLKHSAPLQPWHLVPFTYLVNTHKEQRDTQKAGNWVANLWGKKGERLQETFPTNPVSASNKEKYLSTSLRM